MNGFTRQETIALTGLKPGKISYWDKTGLVPPQKFGNPKKPKVVYSWQQVLKLKLISRLREKLSLQETRKVIDFLEGENYSPSIFECRIFVVNSEAYLIHNINELGEIVVKASGGDRGKVMIQELEPFKTVLANLREEANNNKVLDFEKRIKGTTLELAIS